MAISTQKFKPVDEMSEAEVREELEEFEKQYGFKRPSRSTIDPSRPWRNEVPSYEIADLLYFRGRTCFHKPGSLEFLVEDTVKTWEMEASHLEFKDWTTVDHGQYRVSANGGKVYYGEHAAKAGNYNWLMASAEKGLFDSEKETFESSHTLFRDAFVGGFPWEVVAVFSGPPKIAFSWRHWAEFKGTYRGRKGDGETYDMYGWGLLTVNDNLKVQEIEIFYKPNAFLGALNGTVDPISLQRGATVIGSGCPFLASQKNK